MGNQTIYNGLELSKDKHISSGRRRLANIGLRPVQMTKQSEKDMDWIMDSMDWIDNEGIKIVSRQAKPMVKNMRLSRGIIDRADYVPSDSEGNDIVSLLMDGPEDADLYSIKNFSLIPNIVDTLLTEATQRPFQFAFRCTDEFSKNEILERRRLDIENALVSEFESRYIEQLLEAGADPESPEISQAIEKFSNEDIMSLPEIQEFYQKDYVLIEEKWANKVYESDFDRLRMTELMTDGFRDYLENRTVIYEYVMGETDYSLKAWNPATSFVVHSLDEKYFSSAVIAGNYTMLSVPDVIDSMGQWLSEEDYGKLQDFIQSYASGDGLSGHDNMSGGLYETRLSNDENTKGATVGTRQLRNILSQGPDPLTKYMLEPFSGSDDFFSSFPDYMVRVGRFYWLTQRPYYYLTKIDINGEVTKMEVDENYEVTDSPVYNTMLYDEESERTLIFGEHLEVFWVNEGYGGVKISTNNSGIGGLMESVPPFDPIYIGINGKKPGRLKYQLRGENGSFSVRLPIDGISPFERGIRVPSLVSKLKPAGVGFNLVNNQISDILIDEEGVIVAFDHNMLPKHSMGEDWGPNNLIKAKMTMKGYQLMPLDGTISNTENPTGMNHVQVLDLSQTSRLIGRIQLAEYYRMMGLNIVGLAPQRLGQQTSQYDTARGQEFVMTGSFNQTEMLYVDFFDNLMPRVLTALSELAQYYTAYNPSDRLKNLISVDERVNFEVNRNSIMKRDINVYGLTKSDKNKLLSRLKDRLASDNTLGASIYDFAVLESSSTVKELISKAEAIRSQQMKQEEEARAHEYEMFKAEQERILAEKDKDIAYQKDRDEKNRVRDIVVAQVRAAGYSAMVDINKDGVSDYKERMDEIRASDEFTQTMNIEKDKISVQKENNQANKDIEMEKIRSKERMKMMDVEIAKENRNKYSPPLKNVKNQKKK